MDARLQVLGRRRLSTTRSAGIHREFAATARATAKTLRAEGFIKAGRHFATSVDRWWCLLRLKSCRPVQNNGGRLS